MPAVKKHPSTRARSNRAATAKTLPTTSTASDRQVPELPHHPTAKWHPETLRWWRELWESQLPDSWQSFDTATVFTVALCFNDIWIASSPTARKEALSEFRLQRRDFFIAPYNRLQGEIVFEEADAAKVRGEERRNRGANATAGDLTPTTDPRNVLRAV